MRMTSSFLGIDTGAPLSGNSLMDVRLDQRRKRVESRQSSACLCTVDPTVQKSVYRVGLRVEGLRLSG